jgi:hypothetical protein
MMLCLQEYVTLPPAFYLELDLEQQVLVERANSNPFTLITSGLHQLELQQLIQVRCVLQQKHHDLSSRQFVLARHVCRDRRTNTAKECSIAASCCS